jgi:SAM-dependent methyltransferase
MKWWQNFFDDGTYKIMYELYPERRRETTISHCDFIENVLKPSKHVKILDLACGPGRHSIELAKRGYKVTGFDYSEYFLNKARIFAKQAGVNIRFVQGDMRKLPFQNEFDVVINMFTSFGYFEKEEDHLKVLKQIARSLKPGGKFLLDTINREWLVRNFQAKGWEKGEDFLLLEDRTLDLEHNRSGAKWILLQGNEQKIYQHSLRIFALHELMGLIRQANLKVLSYYGNFKQEPWSCDTNRTIIVAEKI